MGWFGWRSVRVCASTNRLCVCYTTCQTMKHSCTCSGIPDDKSKKVDLSAQTGSNSSSGQSDCPLQSSVICCCPAVDILSSCLTTPFTVAVLYFVESTTTLTFLFNVFSYSVACLKVHLTAYKYSQGCSF